jgi:uncharacterized membrane protein
MILVIVLFVLGCYIQRINKKKFDELDKEIERLKGK